MMGELKFFLGFQIKQMKEGAFLCHIKNQANEGRGLLVSNQVCEGYAQEV
jgi:hypothetical protein